MFVDNEKSYLRSESKYHTEPLALFHSDPELPVNFAHIAKPLHALLKRAHVALIEHVLLALLLHFLVEVLLKFLKTGELFFFLCILALVLITQI